MLKRQITVLFIILIVLSPPLFAISAQVDRPRLQITEFDASKFPDITFHLTYLGLDDRVILDMSDLILREDEQSIPEFDADPIDVGTELIVIIDANTSIEQQDETAGPTRREKVRDSLIRYANLFMDPTQLDSVTIIVPEGDGGRFLDAPTMTFPNEVINAINFYETGDLHDPNLNVMMEMALEQAASTRGEGRFQAILLFSDAGNLGEQLNFDNLVQSARDGELTIYGAILGSRADAEEIEQITRLTGPTGGAYVHMPNPVRTDELYESIQQRANSARISYRSRLNSSGLHILSAEISDQLAEEPFEIVVESPVVRMAVDNSRPIRRVAAEPDIPLEQIEPTHQPLVAEVGWPDGQPRILDSAILLVNGQEMPVQNTIFGDDGLLTFEWDIRFLEEGNYDIQIQVTDELGLQSVSDPLPLAIEIERFELIPTEPLPTSPPPVPTSVPTPDLEDVPLRVIAIGGGILLFGLLLVLLITGVLLIRRRGKDSGEVPVPAPPSQPVANAGQLAWQLPTVKQFDPAITHAIPPDFAAVGIIGALLEPIENAPEHPTMIPIAGNNVSLGRDEKRVQIAFQDKSVSRLHARIMANQGLYRIYDEGSSSGTYVNYKRVGLSPQTLGDKDDIHLGRVHLRFHLPSSYRTDSPSDSETQIYVRPE